MREKQILWIKSDKFSGFKKMFFFFGWLPVIKFRKKKEKRKKIKYGMRFYIGPQAQTNYILTGAIVTLPLSSTTPLIHLPSPSLSNSTSSAVEHHHDHHLSLSPIFDMSLSTPSSFCVPYLIAVPTLLDASSHIFP